MKIIKETISNCFDIPIYRNHKTVTIFDTYYKSLNLKINNTAKQKDLLIQFITDKKWSWIKHSMLCLLVVLNFNPIADQQPGGTIPPEIATDLNRLLKIMLCIMISYSLIIIYFNIYFLIPRLLFQQKYFLYSFVIITFSVGFYFVTTLVENYLLAKYLNTYYFTYRGIEAFASAFTIPFVFLMSVSGYKIFKKWISDSHTLRELQQSQLQVELTNLKNQVNPHFLFNTLNNIRTLNAIDIEKSNQIILGLSDILRYQIYDSNKNLTTLKKDIEMLNQYLLLEKIRRDDFKYEIVVEGNIDNINIPPLLFINFVENAIKHGASSIEPSFCNIHFFIRNDQLMFTCSNSKPAYIVKKETGGVGLKNIERRLELLYNKNFELKLTDITNLYTVNLTLPL